MRERERDTYKDSEREERERKWQYKSLERDGGIHCSIFPIFVEKLKSSVVVPRYLILMFDNIPRYFKSI